MRIEFDSTAQNSPRHH